MGHNQRQPQIPVEDSGLEVSLMQMSDAADEQQLLRLAAEEPFVRSLARDLMADEVDEVVQQAYLQAIEQRPATIRSPRRWLARIARNVASNLRRGTVRRRQHETLAAREFTVSTEELQRRERRRREVLQAVDALAEPFRTAAVLRYYDGLPPRAIAQKLGVPSSTIYNRLHQALRMLRERLDRQHEGNRRAWLLPLVPFAAPPRPPWLPSGESAGHLLPNLTAGVLAMTTKLKITAATAVLTAGAVALLMIYSGSPGDGREPPAPVESGAGVAHGEIGSPPPTTDGTQELTREPVAVEAGATAMLATGSLRIRVTYADDQTPAADLRLAVSHSGNTHSTRFPIHVQTDATGAAVVENLGPGRFYVRPEVNVHAAANAEVRAGEESLVELELKMGINVAGIVVNADDVPVADARVEINHIGQEGRAQPVTVTDAEGRFVLRAAARVCRVGARAPGYAPSMLYTLRGSNGGEVEARIVLPGLGGSLEGRVFSAAGDPIADALVRVGNDADKTVTRPDGGFMRTPVPFDVRTDTEGRFAAFGLAPGEQRLIAHASTFAPSDATVVIPEIGTASVMIRLQPGVTVQGTVRGTDGKPMADASVQLDGGPLRASVWSGPDGAYVLEGLPIGELALKAWANENGKAATKVNGAPGATIQWDPELQKGLELRGRVFDDQDRPVAGALAQISARPSGGRSDPDRLPGWGTLVQSDAAGRFTAANCPDGRLLEVLVMKEGFTRFNGDGIDPRAGEFVVRLQSAEQPTVHVRGIVVDGDGRPVANATVMAVGEDELQGGGTRDTGADGSFDIGPTIAGNYHLFVRAEGYAHHRTGKRVVARGETWNVGRVPLSRGGHVEIELADAALPEGTKFWVYDRTGKSLAHIDVKAGMMKSTPVEPGDYLLSVTGPNVAAQSLPVTVEEGRTARMRVGFAPGVLAKFEFELPAGFQGRRYLRITITGEGGVVRDRWRFFRGEGAMAYEEVLAPGNYSITVEAENGVRGRAETVVAARSAERPTTVMLR